LYSAVVSFARRGVVVSFPNLDSSPALLFVLIFLGELFVVTLGTIRIIFISRGMKLLAPLLGFFEITIWLFAITQVMQNLNDPGCFIAFAAGFTIGNFFGILIEKKLAIGSVLVRIITRRDAADLIDRLRQADYGVTVVEAAGSTGPVKIIFTIIKRKDIDSVIALVKQFNPKAFYSIDDLQSATEGIFPAAQSTAARSIIPTTLQKIMRVGK
ncbi:MAG: DUF2179 domain-containing protein, partial [Gemmataceae bacterium]